MKRNQLEQTYVDYMVKKIMGDPYRNEVCVRSMLHNNASGYSDEDLQAVLEANGYRAPETEWQLVVSKGVGVISVNVRAEFESHVEDYARLIYPGFDVVSIKEISP